MRREGYATYERTTKPEHARTRRSRTPCGCAARSTGGCAASSTGARVEAVVCSRAPCRPPGPSSAHRRARGPVRLRRRRPPGRQRGRGHLPLEVTEASFPARAVDRRGRRRCASGCATPSSAGGPERRRDGRDQGREARGRPGRVRAEHGRLPARRSQPARLDPRRASRAAARPPTPTPGRSAPLAAGADRAPSSGSSPRSRPGTTRSPTASRPAWTARPASPPAPRRAARSTSRSPTSPCPRA